jgi:hypothetical protein
MIAVLELISLATAMPAFPIFDTYLWVAGNRVRAVYFLVWFKSFLKSGGQLRD